MCLATGLLYDGIEVSCIRAGSNSFSLPGCRRVPVRRQQLRQQRLSSYQLDGRTDRVLSVESHDQLKVAKA